MQISLKINLSSKQKIFIIPIIFIGIIIAISFWVLGPAINDIKNLNQQIYEQRLALEKKYVQRFSMRRILRDFKEINESMGKILSIFLLQNDEILFISSIEERADKNIVKLKINLAPEEKYIDGKQKFNLNLNVEGNFENIIGFLNDLEKLDTHILLNYVSMTEKDENELINASIKGYVYKNINL